MKTGMNIAALLLMAFPLAPFANAAEGTVVKEWNFDNLAEFTPKQGEDKFPDGFVNNYVWGKKDIKIGPCEGYKGNGLKFEIRGIPEGEMQFWSPPWQMWQQSYYRISFKAKGEDFPGRIGVLVRQVPHPWTAYLWGWEDRSFKPSNEWKEYSFTGLSKHDIASDFGVLFQTGRVGTFMIDDLKVEVFKENPEAETPKNTNPLVKGNLISRGSMEVKDDNAFVDCTISGDNNVLWQDPRHIRAGGGLFGKSCMFFPMSNGGTTAYSVQIPVAAGHAYTFSAFMKTDAEQVRRPGISILGSALKNRAPQGVLVLKKDLGWQRVSITTDPIPADVISVVLSIEASLSPSENVYLDGLQFEAGTNATEFVPAYPFELGLNMAGADLNTPKVVTWGKKLPLELEAYSATNANSQETIQATLKVIAYPGDVTFEQKVTLEAGKPQKLEIEPNANGILRVVLTADNPKLAAPFEKVMARLPEPRKIGPESAFGIHFTVRPYFINYAKAIGMKWERFHDCTSITKMGGGNPRPGEYVWADKQVDAIRAAGIFILGLPDYPPKWAKRDVKLPETGKTHVMDANKAPADAEPKQQEDKGQKAGIMTNVYDVAAFANWCEKVAGHYKGKIDHWEVWNEPYMPYFFGGTADMYGEIFNAGAKGFRKGNPKATIVGWCTEFSGIGYIGSFFKKYPLKDKPDVLSVHCYYGNVPGDGTTSFKGQLDHNKNFLGEYFPGEIWNTEGNFPIAASFYSFRENPESREEAAAFGVRCWTESIKSGFSKVFLYWMANSDGVLRNGGLNTLTDYDRSVTLVAATTAVTAWFIDGLKPVAAKDRPGVKQSVFSGKDRSTYVVFDDVLVKGMMSLDSSRLPKDYLVCDAMGNDLRKAKSPTRQIARLPLFVMTEKDNVETLIANCQSAISE